MSEWSDSMYTESDYGEMRPVRRGGPERSRSPAPAPPADDEVVVQPVSSVPAWMGVPTRAWRPVPATEEAPVSGAPSSGVPSPGLSGMPTSAPPAGRAPTSAPPGGRAPTSAPPGGRAPTSAPPGGRAPVSAPPRGRGRRAEPPAPAGPDPEQLLATHKWRFDPDTLREVLDERETAKFHTIRNLLTARLSAVTEDTGQARLLSLRASVARVLGDLQRALADGRQAVARAEAADDLRYLAIARARLAHVLHWCGEFAEADRLYALANSDELPDRLRGTIHQHTGKCAYEQGRYMEACNHFEKALDLRKEADPELIAYTELALDGMFRKVAERGWGPYPRSREEILQVRKPPEPEFDEEQELWGYGSDGTYAISPRYSDVQPFHDSVAWVRLPGALTWALIDEGGNLLIQPAAGYLGVSSFSDDLAWVSRDGSTFWIAIDKINRLVITTGYEDVRPFRRGVAAVRREGRWGAVDRSGRVVVPFEYDAFATALHDGRYIDGFSDAGLAIVVRDGRRGVIDHTGRVVIPPIHPALVIHPVAFLIVDEEHRWGALDRRGRLLVDPSFPSRLGVIDELDRLLADTKLIL